MNRDMYNLLGLLGVAALVYLIIAGLVYAGTRRQAKRYRPGRPFEFTPVWFLAQPRLQARAGQAGRELTRASSEPPATRRPQQTGGASDSW